MPTIVTGTNGGDILSFQGTLQQFTETIVNPYSGQSYFIDDVKRVNDAIYDGLAGNDFLFMSAVGDVIKLNDGNGNATLISVEQIIAGDGGDLVLLADANLTMGDMRVSGGNGDDIIWMNVGNDTVFGGNGNDIIDGGPGNDTLYGDAGDDILFGGWGNDRLIGGDGDDILYGGGLPGDNNGYVYSEYLNFSFTGPAFPMPLKKPTQYVAPEGNQGINPDNLTIHYNTTVHIEYIFSEAGYRNSLGFYKIAADGVISNVEIVFKNQHNLQYGDTFTYEYEGTAGESLGIFILANGWNTDHFYRNLDLSTGELTFVYDFGGANERTATIYDSGANVRLVFDDGTNRQALNVTDYHSALAGGVSALNEDGLVHTISGLANEDDPNVLRVGFEDLPFLGDADFDDIVFNMWVEDRVILTPGVDDDDILIGGPGNDTMYGGFGDDILVFGDGADHLYGGFGNDIFLMDTLDAFADTIYDFELGAGRDVLNITDILQGFDALTDAIQDFVQLVSSGSDHHLLINATGQSGNPYIHAVTFEGGLGDINLDTLLAQGNLVVDQTVIY